MVIFILTGFVAGSRVAKLAFFEIAIALLPVFLLDALKEALLCTRERQSMWARVI